MIEFRWHAPVYEYRDWDSRDETWHTREVKFPVVLQFRSGPDAEWATVPVVREVIPHA